MAIQRKLDKPLSRGPAHYPIGYGEAMVLQDGTEWFRWTGEPVEEQE
jgi:hypothetical protein